MKNYTKVYSTSGPVKLRPRIKEREIRTLKNELSRFKRSLSESEQRAWKIEMNKKHGLLIA